MVYRPDTGCLLKWDARTPPRARGQTDFIGYSDKRFDHSPAGARADGLLDEGRCAVRPLPRGRAGRRVVRDHLPSGTPVLPIVTSFWTSAWESTRLKTAASSMQPVKPYRGRCLRDLSEDP